MSIEALKNLIETVTENDRDSMAAQVNRAFADRLAFEIAEGNINTNLERKLERLNKSLVRPSVLNFLIATSISPQFINDSVRKGSRFNVYGVDKFVDLVDFVMGNDTLNAINKAILKNIVGSALGGKSFDYSLAKGSASKRYNIGERGFKGMARHTVDPNATAGTQASSTLRALKAMNLVFEEKSASGDRVFQIADNFVTDAFVERLAA